MKSHIKAHIGPNKKYNAIALEKLPQKKHTYSTTSALLRSIKRGSRTYRKIIERNITTIDIHNPEKWKRKLLCSYVTSQQVQKAMTHLHSPFLDSKSADYLTRLKLGKTLFNNQLFAIGRLDEATCNTCIREYNQNTTEDYQHALFQCPAVQIIIHNITNTFFPNQTHHFMISDILLSTNSDKHKLYKGPIGQELASLIWDYFQVYVIQCRVSQITPISFTAIFEIKSQLNRILKILPKSRVATYIKSSTELHYLITSAPPPHS